MPSEELNQPEIEEVEKTPKIAVEKKVNKKPKKTAKKQKNLKKVNPLTPKNYGFNLNKLPRRYNHWLLDVAKSSHFSGQRCVLKSNAVEIGAGHLHTSIMLEVFSDLIKVSGQSPIDLSYKNLGLKVDTFERVSIDAIVAETNALFFLDSTTLIQQMVRGYNLDVALGFWSSIELDRAYSTKISLEGFSVAIKNLGECDKKLKKING